LKEYEYDPEYLKWFEKEVLVMLGMFWEATRQTIMESVGRVMEHTNDPWGVRFTVVYYDGFEDYVYDNEVRKMFRAPLERIVPILLRHGDVGIVDYPEKGSKMLVRRDRVIEDLKDKLVEKLREYFRWEPVLYPELYL
jgi:thiol-disulfide isomerase/thioredoxin